VTTVTTEQDKQIARTILEQIGAPALFMIGARLRPAMIVESGVIICLGANRESYNRLQIVVNSKDLYDLTFMRIVTPNGKPCEIVKDATVRHVYNDQLRQIITDETGLATSL
jgi:hypothetical protein